MNLYQTWPWKIHGCCSHLKLAFSSGISQPCLVPEESKWHSITMYQDVPVVPARGGAEVALKIYIYKTFLIYRTCMRRAPAKPVRACTLRKLCPVSHVTFEAPLRPSHFSLHSSHSTLHTSHFTLHTSHFTLHSSQSTLHTSHSTLHTSHFSLLIAFFTLHTSHCTLRAPHFTLHSSHSTLHLIWALLTLSQLISSHLISSHMSPISFHEITSQYYY